jgi:4a-hydroxytetrahydrobiopterin dehydratase
MEEKLSQKVCVACQGGIPPLTVDEIKNYLPQISDNWQVIDNIKIKRTFEFGNFTQALNFVNQVGEIAENQNHHPDIILRDYKFVDIKLWTHKISGLHENDFILASKIDLLIK